jgi:hypothetical protein
MVTKVINLAKEFSSTPAGRFSDDGDYSGERFREEFLAPALKDNGNDKVEIILDGLEGVGSSFWEEAFGGLIRGKKASSEIVKKKMVLQCQDDDTLVPLIQNYLNRASK